MGNALEIKGLCKQYEGFALRDVTFTLPGGCVMGFIGENGAGKTTTIKAILNLIRRDAGSIRVLGQDNLADERAVKERIGVVLEDGCFLNTMNARQVDVLMGKAYQNWHSEQFFGFLKRFGIDVDKKIKDYSKGMRMKVNIAAAMSHEAELLLMDEPTSGLDPVVRDEVLDLFYDFMQDDGHSILLSSHITSDLDKIADYITFIHQGQIVLSEPRDELLDTYGVLRCTAEQLSALDPAAVRGKRMGAFGCEALVRRTGVPANWPVEPVNIEQVMLFLTRGEEAR
ncbi:ABC transporter ATP-binding protein [Agathobaculum sp. Marseille-P7918]|uniref:ABC transporter ATP-binding protein n=1 Tax=Agathobaculum sp. Marseille-P7918 TaxID=2479843 RepID=UPI000F638370|nr:ABC transporter ATP-binding protein [Agathobaculum sp. Marseille-P7918]